MNRMWTVAAMALGGMVGAYADSTSVEFYDPTGTTITSKIGWKGTAAAGEFFIETPSDGNGVTVRQGNITANRFTGDGSGLSNLPKATPWDSVSGKPTTYPAATHAHATGDVSGLQAALDGKAGLSGASFTGAVGFQQNVSMELNDTLKFGTGLKMTSYSPTGGVYEGLIDAPHGIRMPTKLTLSDADAQVIIIGTAGQNPPELAITGDATITGAVTAGRFNGDGSGLTNVPAGTPSAHTHPISEVTNLQSTLDGKANLAGANFTGNVALELGDSVKFGAGLKMTSYSPTGGVYEGLIDAPHGIRMPTKLTLSDADAQVIVVGTVGGPPEIGVTGDVNVSGTVTAATIVGTSTCCASDLRYKRNVRPLGNCLQKVSKMQGVEYDWVEAHEDFAFTDQHQIGLIAQDVEGVVPEVVVTNEKGYKALDYGKLTAVLIEAVKEQQAEITALRARLDQLGAGR